MELVTVTRLLFELPRSDRCAMMCLSRTYATLFYRIRAYRPACVALISEEYKSPEELVDDGLSGELLADDWIFAWRAYPIAYRHAISKNCLRLLLTKPRRIPLVNTLTTTDLLTLSKAIEAAPRHFGPEVILFYQDSLTTTAHIDVIVRKSIDNASDYAYLQDTLPRDKMEWMRTQLRLMLMHGELPTLPLVPYYELADAYDVVGLVRKKPTSYTLEQLAYYPRFLKARFNGVCDEITDIFCKYIKLGYLKHAWLILNEWCVEECFQPRYVDKMSQVLLKKLLPADAERFMAKLAHHR